MPRFILAGLLFLVTTIAFADVPAPPEPKRVNPRVKFVGIEKHRDYVFFLTYDLGVNTRAVRPPFVPDVKFQREPEFKVQIKNDRELTLECRGRWLTNVTLLALTQRDFDKLKGSQPWPSEKTAGVLIASIPSPNNVAPRFGFRPPLTEYRVAIKDNKLDVATPGKLRSEAAPMPVWPIGLACGLAIVSLGIWFSRRAAVRIG